MFTQHLPEMAHHHQADLRQAADRWRLARSSRSSRTTRTSPARQLRTVEAERVGSDVRTSVPPCSACPSVA